MGVGGGGGGRSPSLNNVEHTEICKERKASTLNESVLAEYFSNRLDKINSVHFPPTPD